VLEFVFELDFLLYTYIHVFDHFCTQYGLEPDLPERNCCMGRGLCVCVTRLAFRVL